MSTLESTPIGREALPYHAPAMRLESGQYGVLNLETLAETPLLLPEQTEAELGVAVPTLARAEIEDYKGRPKSVFILDVRGVGVSVDGNGQNPRKVLSVAPAGYILASTEAMPRQWELPADAQLVVVGAAWRTNYIDDRGKSQPNMAASDARATWDWQAIRSGEGVRLGGESKGQSQQGLSIEFPDPTQNITLRVDDDTISVANGMRSALTLHYRGATDPNDAEVPIAADEAADASAVEGMPIEVSPIAAEIGAAAVEGGTGDQQPQETVAAAEPVAAQDVATRGAAEFDVAGDVARAEAATHEISPEDRQALDELYAYAQESDPAVFDAKLGSLIDAGKGMLVVDNLPMLTLSMANATHIARQFIAHNQAAQVLDNFHQFVVCGGDPEAMLEYMGAKLEEYLGDDARAVAFGRANLGILGYAGVRKVLSHAGLGFSLPNEQGNELFGRPVMARRAHDRVRVTYLDEGSQGQARANDTEGERHSKLFQIRPGDQKWPVNEQTIEEAANRLDAALRQDPSLSAIINRYKSTLRLDQRPDVVRALRSNRDLRLAVGSHLLARAEALARSNLAPRRIRDNTNKVIGDGGYPVSRATSREYAAMLALAMLDGTFDQSRVIKSDQTLTNLDGTVGNGNHRIGAEMILGIWRPNR